MIRFPAPAPGLAAGLSVQDLIGAAAVLAVLIGAAAYLSPREQARVAGRAIVIDGDSLRIDGAEIRLLGLDAPELHQTCTIGERPYPCGEEARRELVRLVGAGPLACEVRGHDRYGRRLARCTVAGRDLGAALVASGLAVSYGGYAAEEAEARRNRAGLWAGTFQRPSEWRKERPRS